MTRSSVFARLSCRWCFFHPCRDVPPGSLRSVQLPLDHLVEKRDRAVCHRRSNGRRSHVPVWWVPVIVVYVEKRRGPRTDPWGTPVTSWCALDTSPPQATLKDLYRWDRIQTSEVESQWCPKRWEGGQEDHDDWQCQSSRRSSRMRDWWFGSAFRLAGLQWLRVVQSLLNGHSWNLTV